MPCIFICAKKQLTFNKILCNLKLQGQTTLKLTFSILHSCAQRFVACGFVAVIEVYQFLQRLRDEYALVGVVVPHIYALFFGFAADDGVTEIVAATVVAEKQEAIERHIDAFRHAAQILIFGNQARDGKYGAIVTVGLTVKIVKVLGQIDAELGFYRRDVVFGGGVGEIYPFDVGQCVVKFFVATQNKLSSLSSLFSIAPISVFMALMRANFLSLDSITVQGAKSVEVYFNISLQHSSY